MASVGAILGVVFVMVPSAKAQQTVITNGGVTVRNPNGTTTKITNTGVTTTRHNGTVTTVHTRKKVMRRRISGGNVGSGSATVNENNHTMTIRSNHGAVTISGNHNRITVTGTCARLSIPGNGNTVTANSVAAISVPGNNNTVYWQSGASGGRSVPRITQSGSGNTVSRR